MDVNYIAFDSMGVKASCFQIQAGTDRVIVDPGVSIETDTFPLSESEKMYIRRNHELKVKKKAKNSNIAVLSHYHYDHYTEEPDRKVYGRKKLFVKHPRQDISGDQEERAGNLLDQVEDMAEDIVFADGETFYLDQLKIAFGKPMWHGASGTHMGKVVPMVFENTSTGETVLYTSDMDGPVEEESADWIIEQDPDTLILNGAPTYMLDFVLSYQDYARAVLNLRRIIDETWPEKIILDHHLLRDYRYRDLYDVAFKSAEKNKVPMHTAAEERGKSPKVVEAYEQRGTGEWSSWPTPTLRQLIAIADGEDPKQVFSN